ncbi:hypothetical protein LMG8520_2586 [Lactococcus lactis subsp. lactis]|uniref:Uncharacterized protein n=2 Tax=Lactococcus lactis TaxID=1358 RepID=A0A2A5SB73_LACLH|nr:hypothetical protein [Lactococcus lactis]KAA8701871.1 hypothetical protein F4V48_07975 [Lactococcus lactis subsp. hordniae]KSU05289.1 hypothetical protein LMG8520_2586 [Lactococcus lactis subsp. lactis]MCT3134154.1 hypothetical protein [Lactococcus lactis]PCS10708.1 hypothetical protein RU90_GL001207 [Lactococcus lactis subsp. hordniae]
MDDLEKIIKIPTDFKLVSRKSELRNNKKVDILRFQKDGAFMLNGPRIIIVLSNNNLVSIKNLTTLPVGKLPDKLKAQKITQKVFSIANLEYSRNLSFIRIDKQQRTFINSQGELNQFPVLWIKYGHKNGSYNWVTLGAEGTIIEMEFDSRWDYYNGRRKTEMWDNDDWVLAREGRGPQLPSPSALA